MATNFPSSDDVFTEPGVPASTALSSPGSGSRTHTEHHRDLGDAIEAMQAQATLLIHSHDGSTTRHGSKLVQANTHQSPDTDSATSALHHTLGTGANQAAAGNHTHTQATSHSSPDTDSATSALHHTLGTGANQAAAGDHIHSHAITLYIKASTSFTKASYPGLYAIEVELVGGGGGSGYCAATGASTVSWGMGGSGAGYVKAMILASSLSSSETITIGAGGVGGTSGSKIGGTGGTTSFGSICSALGGPGGFDQTATTGGVQNAQSPGGLYSGTYDLGIQGGNGGQNNLTYESGWFYSSGGLDGQASGGPYGFLTRSTSGYGSGGISSAVAGSGYGSGATGPSNYFSLSAKNGAAGSAGLCVIRLIF